MELVLLSVLSEGDLSYQLLVSGSEEEVTNSNFVQLPGSTSQTNTGIIHI